MRINKYFLSFFFISFLFSSVNFNYESKYGNGLNVDDQTQDTTAYYYFENLLDINLSYDNLYIYSQLEYSNSPIYGIDRVAIDSLANTYFIEYSNSNVTLKWGHLRTLYGYGLALNTFQDQSTDFDNRIKGVEFKYSPSEMMDLFFVSGEGVYETKTKGNLRVKDLSFDHELDLYGAQLYTEFGDFLILSSNKTTYYSPDIYDALKTSNTRMSIDLSDFWIENFSAWDSLSSLESQVDINSLNLSYSKTLGNLDIYIENIWDSYNKILRDDLVDSQSKYFSISTDINDISFVYEYKDYNRLYYMPISSNPPLVFGESTSVLMSRNQHNINFSDEIGHQLESRFDFKNISFLMNLSMGRTHQGVRNVNDISSDENGNFVYGTYEAPSFSDILGLGSVDGMDFLDEDLRAHNPFRDFYVEASGWRKNNTFYYKVGYDSHYSYDGSKNYQSYTIPTQFVVGFANQNSLTVYYETQKTKNLFDNPTFEENENGDIEQIPGYGYDRYENKYMSLSYHINKIGSISYFYDKEVKNFSNDTNKKNSWEGFEVTFEITPAMQLSIFKGSQKGGLVCANGICAVQPSFEDGVKLTLRALF